MNEDIFFRKDNFENEPWYNEFCIFLNIGVCSVDADQADAVQNALNIMGYDTKLLNKDEKVYIVGK